MASRRVVIAASGFLTVATLLIAVGVGELVLRTIHLTRDGIPFFEAPSGKVGAITFDPRVGWRATEGYERDLFETTQGGKVYRVHRSQKAHGFRAYGNVASRQPKLLVIGDSYTQAAAVSDDRTYYARLKDALGIEVFAYGAGGYGTLQEYLILDEVVDEIRPTMILWQFCMNDFINNDYALETASHVNNNGWTRPYWVDGHIVLQSPKPTGVQVREWINRHSRFLYFVISRIDRLRARVVPETVEREIERMGEQHAAFARSVRITDELMGLVRARAGAIPIFAFNCEDQEPYNTAFAKIAAHHGIRYWEDVPRAIRLAVESGLDVLAADGAHWNEEGHAFIASSLTKHLQESRVLVAKH